MNDNNLTDRIVNTLSYLSILFLPVIFPLIVWIIAKSSDRPTIAKNARYAFWTFALLLALLLFIYNIAMAVKMLIGRE